MAGGFLMGLGRGVESAGDAYAKAKQAAIDRMFREQQLAMQQQQIDATLENQAFDREYKVRSQLPAGSDLAGFGDPRFASIFSPLEKRGTRPDPTLPAKTLPMPVTLPPTTGEGEWQGSPAMPVQQTEATMPVQDLTPKIDTRTSVPFEDTRARTAMATEAGRQARHAASIATRERIQAMKDQVQREILASTDANRRQVLAQGWQRINQMQQAYELRAQQVGADIANMEYDNLLNAYIAEHGRPSTGGGGMDPFQQAFIQSILGQGGAGAAPAVPTQPAAPPRPAPPQPPSLRGGASSAPPTDPSDPLGIRRR